MSQATISSHGTRFEACPGLDDAGVPSALYASKSAKDPNRQQLLLFFIPGNPGLISYYTQFFEALRRRLDEIEAKNPSTALHLYAENLIGFSDDDHESFRAQGREPFNLEDQINCFCRRTSQLSVDGRAPDQIMLMGHSVGSYIAVEVFDRLSKVSLDAPRPNLRAGILLFPTVTHLAKSPSGKQLDMLRKISFLNRNAHHIAKDFVDLIPNTILNFFIRRIMGFSADATDATVQFLRSRDGIWQALYLGKDELRTITEEKWSEDLWEIADQALAEKHDVPKFFFYFGENDHWVAEECREEFIQKRNDHAARDGPKDKQGRTKIVIDEHKTPHAFCINHNEIVAEKISVWIHELAETGL